MTKLATAFTILGLILLGAIIWEVVRLLQLKHNVSVYAAYWNQSQAAQSNEILYVAVGDSVAQAIGASTVNRGYVGLIADDLRQRTGRPVHVINLSKTGARVADVVRDQLPRLADLKPDLVTLDIGANDVVRNTPRADFEHDYGTILGALPAGRSVVADLPAFLRKDPSHNAEPWNGLVREAIASHGYFTAPIYDRTLITRRDLTTYAADFFHPNDKGYRNWYEAFRPEVEQIIGTK